jgi:hypothetical protein
MNNRPAIGKISLWVITVGVLGYFFIHGWTTTGTDKRIAVQLAPAERDLVLAEMRQMLTSVHGLIEAAARTDQKGMEDAVRASGMHMAADVNPMLMAKLPLEFKQLGMSVHGDFDKLAVALAGGLDQAAALRDLSNITGRCVACHAAYRLP